MLALDLNVNSMTAVKNTGITGSNELPSVDFQSVLGKTSLDANVPSSGKALPVNADKIESVDLSLDDFNDVSLADESEESATIYDLSDETDDYSLALCDKQLTDSDFQLCDDYARVQQDVCTAMFMPSNTKGMQDINSVGDEDLDVEFISTLPSSDENLSTSESSIKLSNNTGAETDNNLTDSVLVKTTLADQISSVSLGNTKNVELIPELIPSANKDSMVKVEPNISNNLDTETNKVQTDLSKIISNDFENSTQSLSEVEVATGNSIESTSDLSKSDLLNNTSSVIAKESKVQIGKESVQTSATSEKPLITANETTKADIAKLDSLVSDNAEVISVKFNSKSHKSVSDSKITNAKSLSSTSQLLNSETEDTVDLLNKMQNAIKSGTTISSDTSKSAEIITLARGLKNTKVGVEEEVDYVSEDLLADNSLVDINDEFGNLLNSEDQKLSNVIYSVANHTAEAKPNNAFTSASISNADTSMNVRSGEASSSNAATADASGNLDSFDNKVQLFEGKSETNAENIKNKVMQMSAKNLREVELELNPHNLGKMKVLIDLDEGNKASVSFMVTNSSAKEMLNSSMPKLKEYLNQAGVSLTEQNVNQDRGDDSSQGRERASSTWHDNLVKAASSSGADWLEVMNKNSADTDFENLPDGVRSMKIVHSEKDAVDYFA